MIQLEKKALEALSSLWMRTASAGTRDLLYRMRTDPEMKLTRAQALHLWRLVYTYRRQIGDADLLTPAAIAHKTNMLPDIYLKTDQREPATKTPPNGKFGGRGSGSRQQKPAAPVRTNAQKNLFEGNA